MKSKLSLLLLTAIITTLIYATVLYKTGGFYEIYTPEGNTSSTEESKTKTDSRANVRSHASSTDFISRVVPDRIVDK